MDYTYMTYTVEATSIIKNAAIMAGSLIMAMLSFIVLYKMDSNDRKKMIKAQSFALANPDTIEKIKLVEHRKIYCVVTIASKEPTIIAQGVQAVRVFDQLVAANPKLAN